MLLPTLKKSIICSNTGYLNEDNSTVQSTKKFAHNFQLPIMHFSSKIIRRTSTCQTHNAQVLSNIEKGSVRQYREGKCSTTLDCGDIHYFIAFYHTTIYRLRKKLTINYIKPFQ